MRVVMVVLDAFPNSLISRELTPTLHALSQSGTRHRLGGISEMTAATYPNHATFVTGVPTIDHGIMTNRVQQDSLWVAAAEVGPATPTLFDACAAEGRGSVCVVGDHKLVGVCGGASADHCWPPNGVKPGSARLGLSGYIADSEVVREVAGLELADYDFLFFQLDEVDGVRHAHGAWSEEAIEQVRRTDISLGLLVELLQPAWDETVLLVVSDHDQEDVSESDPIDLRHKLPGNLLVDSQGTAALVVGSVASETLLSVAGVVGVASLDPTHHVVWGAAGQVFGTKHSCRAEHGSPRTSTQVALVAGGHPRATDLARRLRVERPGAARWAQWTSELLQLRWRPEPGRRAANCRAQATAM